MRGLDGKVVVVAGGGSGIGAAAAGRLAEEGASVVVGDIVAPNAEAVAGAIRASGGTAIAAEFDISDDDSVAGLVAATVAEFGGLDFLHANAADLSADVIMRDSDAVAVELGVFDRTIAVNLRGHLLCTRHAVPEMLQTRRRGHRLHELGRRARRRTGAAVVRGVEERDQRAHAPRVVALGP